LWRIKTGDYGCSVDVVARDGYWLQWANTIPALKHRHTWGKPVKGKWGVDTPEPLPRLNATIRPGGLLTLR
jgi:hypothetical protein